MTNTSGHRSLGRWSGVVLLSIFLVSTPAWAAPGPQTHKITGQVVNEYGRSIGHIEVRLEAFDRTRKTLTDVSGRFQFAGVPAGRCQLLIDPVGYNEVREPTTAGDYGPILIVLRPIRPFRSDKPSESSMVSVDQLLTDEAIRNFNRGIKAGKKGDTESAIEHLTKAVDASPTFYHAHAQLGTIYQGLERFDDAEREYGIARTLDPNQSLPLVNLSYIYLRRNQYGKAVEVLGLATKLKPPSSSAFLNLGIALFRSGRLYEAEAPLLRALALNPDTPDTRLMLANVYLGTRDNERLLTQLDAYLRTNPDGPNVRRVIQMRFEALTALANAPVTSESSEIDSGTVHR